MSPLMTLTRYLATSGSLRQRSVRSGTDLAAGPLAVAMAANASRTSVRVGSSPEGRRLDSLNRSNTAWPRSDERS